MRLLIQAGRNIKNKKERGTYRDGGATGPREFQQKDFIPKCTGSARVAQREYDEAKKWTREYSKRKRTAAEKKTTHEYKDI